MMRVSNLHNKILLQANLTSLKLYIRSRKKKNRQTMSINLIAFSSHLETVMEIHSKLKNKIISIEITIENQVSVKTFSTEIRTL